MPPPNYTPTGGSTNRERGADRNRSQTLSPSVRARNTASMNKVKAKQGKDKLDNYQVKKLPPTGVIPLVLNAAQDFRQKSFEANRKFFQEKVLTSKNRGNYVDTFDSYSAYMKARGAGTIDAYGNPLSQGGGNDNNNTLVSGVVTNNGIVGPIVGSNAVKTPEEIKKEEEKKNKTSGIILAKRRGRSDTILTGSTGLTDEDDLVRRKTLLG
mgnify:FL=1